MQLRVVVTARGPAPGAGVPLRVEVRDTSVADSGATVVAAATEPVTGPDGSALAELTFDLPDDGAPRDWTVWAHVRAAGEERVTSGDWITVQSYPVQSYPSSSPAPAGAESGDPAPVVAVEVVQI